MSIETMTKLATFTAAGGESSFTFSNIPQTYTDLKMVWSARSTNASTDELLVVYFNGNTSSYSETRLYGTGSSAGSDKWSQAGFKFPEMNGNSSTSNIFSNGEMYLPNYLSSSNKSVNFDAVVENNATASFQVLNAGLWSNTSAITSITVAPNSGNFMQYSTFTLYGIKAVRSYSTAKATGGQISFDGTYYYHTFTNTGLFTPNTTLLADVLVIAGGGGAGYYYGGGGGAGGLRGLASQSLSSGIAYTAIIGSGGAGSSGSSNRGVNGVNSSFYGLGISTITSSGGGGGASNNNQNGLNGGSGGGGSGGGAPGSGNAGGYSPVEGYAGYSFYGYHTSGGGGGAGGAASGSSGKGHGANGTSEYSSWGLATSTGDNRSGIIYYAGGGSGAPGDTSLGGYGGGGGYQGQMHLLAGSYAGAPNTGGGAGSDGETGGSGLIIVRYKA